MLSGIEATIQLVSTNESTTNHERKKYLDEMIQYIHKKVASNEAIRFIFICTHNSRRSHLTQIWCQTMAFYFGIKDVYCYSGGTETTAMFPKIVETLKQQGFQINSMVSQVKNETIFSNSTITDTSLLHQPSQSNIVYSVKYALNEPAMACFSKVYSDPFNPVSDFAAIMTCASADQGCPYIAGANVIRIPVRYDDPKAFDGSDQMDAKYLERSLEIASDMYYVFSNCSTATVV